MQRKELDKIFMLYQKTRHEIAGTRAPETLTFVKVQPCMSSRSRLESVKQLLSSNPYKEKRDGSNSMLRKGEREEGSVDP